MSRERHWFERTANDITVQRGFQFFAGTEVMALQHLLDPAVETLDHAIGLRMLRRRQAVFDAQVVTEPVELVLAGGDTFAKAEQAVGKLAVIVRENGPDPHPLPGRALQSNGPRGGQARSRSLRNRRAFAAVLELQMRMKTQRVAPLSRFEGKPLPGNGSMATNR